MVCVAIEVVRVGSSQVSEEGKVLGRNASFAQNPLVASYGRAADDAFVRSASSRCGSLFVLSAHTHQL